MHCFYMCVCSSSDLGDLLGVSRSIESDHLSVLLIYSRIFLSVYLYHLLLATSYCVYVFPCVYVCCFGLVISTCQPASHYDTQ